ncbi:MAG: hypothetical protein Fur0037_17490 [Planctomycetota bacterium]
MKWRDGKLVGGDSPSEGRGLFETMRARDGELPLWGRHLARLSASAARWGIPFDPPDDLRAAARSLLRRNGHEDGALRLLLLEQGGLELMTRSAAPAPSVVRLLPTLCRRRADDPPPDLKAQPRTFYSEVLAEAQDGGADDGIVLDQRGFALETALGNLWLLLGGTWVTPPADGRILPGIARGILLERARERGVPAAERPCDLSDLHRADALAVSNALHGPRAAALLPGEAKTDSPLRALWPI